MLCVYVCVDLCGMLMCFLWHYNYVWWMNYWSHDKSGGSELTTSQLHEQLFCAKNWVARENITARSEMTIPWTLSQPKKRYHDLGCRTVVRRLDWFLDKLYGDENYRIRKLEFHWAPSNMLFSCLCCDVSYILIFGVWFDFVECWLNDVSSYIKYTA